MHSRQHPDKTQLFDKLSTDFAAAKNSRSTCSCGEEMGEWIFSDDEESYDGLDEMLGLIPVE
jgi:hypothetical protein